MIKIFLGVIIFFILVIYICKTLISRVRNGSTPASTQGGYYQSNRPYTADELVSKLTRSVNEYLVDTISLLPSSGDKIVLKNYNAHLVFDPGTIRLVWTHHSTCLHPDGSETDLRTETLDDWITYLDLSHWDVSMGEYIQPVSSAIIQNAKNALLGHDFSGFRVDNSGNVYKYS